MQFREEHFWIFDASTPWHGHKPTDIGAATGQRNASACIADLCQMTKVPILEVIHTNELLDSLKTLRLTAGLCNVQQAPGNRMLGSLPPLANRIDDDTNPFLFILLLLLQLAHGFSINVIFNVDVFGATFVRFLLLLVHILSEIFSDLRCLVEDDAGTEIRLC